MYYPHGTSTEDSEDEFSVDRSKIKLRINFLIYNPQLKPPHEHRHNEDECQSAKIMYFYQDDLSEHEQRKQAGLVEGVIEFMGAFTTDEDEYSKHPVETISTTLFTACVKQVEK